MTRRGAGDAGGVIAVALHEDSGFIRSVIRGVAECLRGSGRWRVCRVPPSSLVRGGRLPEGCRGVITHVHDRRLLETLTAWGGPVACVSRLLDDDPFPHIGVDDRAVGRCAADHLLHRGSRAMAYVGLPGSSFSRLRAEGFAGRVAEAGSLVDKRAVSPRWIVHTPPSQTRRLRQLDAWLADIPKPLSVFAANDAVAWFVLERCRSLGLRVPSDVAVLGVDDDDVLCRLALVPLSSVVLPGERIGFLAAERVERAAATGRPVGEDTLPPLRVEVRQSTEHYAVEDPDVLEALTYIQRHATEGIDVNALLRAVPVGRRSLERKFRQRLRRTPLEEIHRVRIEAAKRLLSGTRLPIDVIARRVGIEQANYLGKLFRAHTGMSPNAYRRLGS